jgi:hypothetical protein
MSVELNHTIIPAKDKWVSAKFLADILNLEAGPEWGHFVPVKTANGVTLDFDTAVLTACRARGARFAVAQDARRDDPGLATIRNPGNVGSKETMGCGFPTVCGVVAWPVSVPDTQRAWHGW